MSPDARTALAPAKVNLFLHVGPLRADGYHPVASLAAFADIGDTIDMAPADTLSLTIDGPFGAGLDAGAGNLVIRALAALGEAVGRPPPPVAVRLHKALPVAAGLGGGSSDAGAALRLARDLPGYGIDDEGLEGVAARLGADGPLCLWARAALATGVGEVLSPAPHLPTLHAVLVNPAVPSPTGAVYRAYDIAPRQADLPDMPARLDDLDAVLAWLGQLRNDLEAPAISLEPVIGLGLEALRADPDVRLARLSGSGATAFGLCDSAERAGAVARRIASIHPTWWVKPCMFSAS